MTLMPDLQRDLIDAAERARSRQRLARRALVLALAVLASGAFVVALVEWPRSDGRPAGSPDRAGSSDRDLAPGEDLTAPDRPPPKPRFRPLAGTLSKPVVFRFAGVRYRTVAFRSRHASLCVQLAPKLPGRPTGGRPQVTCAGERYLRRQLEVTRVLNVGWGGGPPYSVAGFAAADVQQVAVAGSGQPSRVVLSAPWQPHGWRGKPIRAFVAVVAQPPGGGRVPRRALLRIRVVPAR